jgi:Zn-dependent protease with chaperone function
MLVARLYRKGVAESVEVYPCVNGQRLIIDDDLSFNLDGFQLELGGHTGDKIKLTSTDKSTALVFDDPEILEALCTNAAHSAIGEQAERAIRKLQSQPLANFGYWATIFGVLAALILLGYFSIEAVTAFAVDHVDPRFETEIGKLAADKRKWEEHSQYSPRLQKIGNRLVANLDACPFKFTFHVQRDPTINAMAYPGGTVVVNTGLLEKASDDELAGVLGHEFGHVIHHDSLRSVVRNSGLVSILAVISGLGQANAEQVVDALALAQRLESLRYGRSQEASADLVGVDLATKSGYKGDALIVFFARLQKENGGGMDNKYLELISTHPMDANRIAAVKAEVERLRQAGGNAKRDPSVKQ